MVVTLIVLNFPSDMALAVAQNPTSSASPSVVDLVGRRLSVREVQAFLQRLAAFPPQHTTREDGQYYREYKAAGVSLLCNRDDRIITVFLYSEGREGYGQFRQSLPGSLRFEDDRSTVTRKLGQPTCAGGGENGAQGRVEIWDKWQMNWGTLHVTYRQDGKIGLVTLMTPSSDPGCRSAR